MIACFPVSSRFLAFRAGNVVPALLIQHVSYSSVKTSPYSPLKESTTVASHPSVKKYSQSQKNCGLLLFLAHTVATKWLFMDVVVLVLEEKLTSDVWIVGCFKYRADWDLLWCKRINGTIKDIYKRESKSCSIWLKCMTCGYIDVLLSLNCAVWGKAKGLLLTDLSNRFHVANSVSWSFVLLPYDTLRFYE